MIISRIHKLDRNFLFSFDKEWTASSCSWSVYPIQVTNSIFMSTILVWIFLRKYSEICFRFILTIFYVEVKQRRSIGTFKSISGLLQTVAITINNFL